MRQQEQSPIVVAPIISQQKQSELISNIFQTVLGFNKHITDSPLKIVWSILICLTTFLIPLLVPNVYVAIIVPVIVNIIGTIIVDCIAKQESIGIGQLIIKQIIVGVHSMLWSSHIYCLATYPSSQIALFVLSAYCIITSTLTVAVSPVKQFSANGIDNAQISLGSTLYMRCFISIPTLLAEFIIYHNGTNTTSPALYPLRLINSLIFIIWTMGWLPSLGNTLYFLFNKIGMVVLGNQSQPGLTSSIIGLIVSMLPIAAYEISYYMTGRVYLQPLIIGATLSAIFTFLRYNLNLDKINSKGSNIRPLILISVQLLVCLALNILFSVVNLDGVNLTTPLIINICIFGLFFFLKQISVGWSRLGCNFQFNLIGYSYLLLVQRTLLRIICGFCVLIILTKHQNDYLSCFAFENNILFYIIVPFLAYRSFNRTLSQTNTFSLHVSLLICLILINTENVAVGCLIVLVMPPFPPNPYLTLFSVFSIPPKAVHKNQCCYQIAYFILTFIGVCVHFASLGLFQLSMVFGLPIYAPIISTQTEGYDSNSAQNSLYSKIVDSIDSSLFRGYDSGSYLLRIDKYIMLMQVKTTCYGLAQIIDFRGLQVQEVTSCHSKEGQTIDRLVQQTWGDNGKSCSLSPLFTAIAPMLKHKVHVPTQNDLQLTGVIEAQQFIQFFKKTCLMSIIRQYSRISLTQNQKRQGEIIVSQLNAFYKKQQAQSLFLFDFAKQCELKAAYPLQIGRNKLPPIAKKQNKKEVVDDFMDLLDSGGPFQASNSALTTNKEDRQPSQIKKEGKLEQVNMAVVLTLYYYSVGKQDYVNTEKLFKIIKRQTQTIPQIQFQGFQLLLARALGAAFKISISKYIDGQFDVSIQDFKQYDQSSFLGTTDSDDFKQAILQNKSDVWTINYTKKTNLAIKRMALNETDMYVFRVDEVIMRSVWNNLRFELIYATNDNDQRYSIQTHPTLLRNLWVQACEQPFGYPSYHSGLKINR